MSKFGLDAGAPELVQKDQLDIADKLAAFSATAPRHRIDIPAMDAAAAHHGFVSREVSTLTSPVRRRRLGVAEPTRHLAIRLTATQYARFVAYADAEKLTYHDALISLLDRVGR